MRVLKSIMNVTLASVAFIFIVSLTACKSKQDTSAVVTDEEAAKTEAQQQTPTLNDAQIASIVVTANQIDVNYGKIAIEKSKNAEVTNFANTMIKDHETIIKSATDLAGQLGVTPEDNPITQSLLQGEKDVNAKLSSLTGDDFDKAYIDNEVTYHDAVITTVKNVIIPQTQNDQLKQALVDVMPLLEHHLMMAKEAQSKIINK